MSAILYNDCETLYIVDVEDEGSAKDLYQTQINLTDPAFKCICPIRKFPCKHALGLFLLFANQPDQFSQHEPPAWVSECAAKRAKQASRSNPNKADADPTAMAKAQARSFLNSRADGRNDHKPATICANQRVIVASAWDVQRTRTDKPF